MHHLDINDDVESRNINEAIKITNNLSLEERNWYVRVHGLGEHQCVNTQNSTIGCSGPADLAASSVPHTPTIANR